jgi:hypothetical protein
MAFEGLLTMKADRLTLWGYWLRHRVNLALSSGESIVIVSPQHLGQPLQRFMTELVATDTPHFLHHTIPRFSCGTLSTIKSKFIGCSLGASVGRFLCGAGAGTIVSGSPLSAVRDWIA